MRVERLKKVKDQRGETILEVLLSLLIVALCVSFFVGSLVKANEGNKQDRSSNQFNFKYSEAGLFKSGAAVMVDEYSIPSVDIYQYKNNASHSYYYVHVPDSQ